MCRQWGQREAKERKGEKKKNTINQQKRLLSLKNQCQSKKEITLTASSGILFRKLFHLHAVACEAMRTGISRRHGNKSYDVDNMDFYEKVHPIFNCDYMPFNMEIPF